jgi:serine/threonine protein kinase
VALKVLSSRFERDEVTRARFLREVTLGRQLAHPFIVRIFDYGSLNDGLPFISMERVHGGSLRARLSQGRCEPKLAYELFRQIAEALEYAHERGVLHRDLKPDNILLTDKGDVRITDFGTAKGEDDGKALTKTGETIGTPLYMAPEVVKGRRADVRSDLYSLGVLGFELVMGNPPFQSDNWVVLSGMHLSTPPPPIDTPGVSERYREAIARLIEKDPNARFQTAHQLREFLSSGPHNPGRHSWINMATGLAIGLMLGGVLGLFALKLWAAIH